MTRSFTRAIVIVLLSVMLAAPPAAAATGFPAASGPLSPDLTPYVERGTGSQSGGGGLPAGYRPTPTPWPPREDTGQPAYAEPITKLGLPWRPPVTPTPVPSGGLEPVKGYGLPWRPPVTPTPAPLPPYVLKEPGLAQPYRSPVLTPIPQVAVKPVGPGAGQFLKSR